MRQDLFARVNVWRRQVAMKLSHYAIAEHMAARDWRGAARILADHFGLKIQLPDQISIYHDYIDEAVIYIYCDRTSYRWNSRGGFASFRGYTGLGIRSNVYLPALSQE
jgi:hypothetical protein